MKFAIPTAEGKLTAHFGHCQEFAILDVENNEITAQAMLTPPPHEPGVLPKWLNDMGTNIIIAGGMGHKAKVFFDDFGINVITGAPVDTPENLVRQYLTETLVTGDNLCDH